MKWFPKFGKPQYSAPQVHDVPAGQGSDQNGTYINEQGRCLIVKLFDGGKPEDLAKALGTLEIAKDIAKQCLSVWHTKDAQRKAILVPKLNGNPNGGLSVL